MHLSSNKCDKAKLNGTVCSELQAQLGHIFAGSQCAPAKEDVSTTRLTVLRFFATAPSTFLVPLTAGSTKSRWPSCTFLMHAKARFQLADILILL